MNRYLMAARSGLLLAFLTAPAVADEILIYKYASPRPWTLYSCLRPDEVSTPAAPVVAKNTLSGTYTQTEYWVVNKTTGEYAIVNYSATAYKGTVDKSYHYDGEAIPFLRTVVDPTGEDFHEVPTLAHLPTGRPNTYNTSLQFGHVEEDSDGSGGNYHYTEQAILMGVSKPYATGLSWTFQQVATSLKGPYLYSHREDTVTGGTGAVLRSLYFEKITTNSLTLDALATKKANAQGQLIPYEGGAAIRQGSIAYGLRVVGLQLEAIGYDFADLTSAE